MNQGFTVNLVVINIKFIIITAHNNFKNVYTINIYNFDIKTIKARIQFVQQHEVKMNPSPIYFFL